MADPAPNWTNSIRGVSGYKYSVRLATRIYLALIGTAAILSLVGFVFAVVLMGIDEATRSVPVMVQNVAFMMAGATFGVVLVPFVTAFYFAIAMLPFYIFALLMIGMVRVASGD